MLGLPKSAWCAVLVGAVLRGGLLFWESLSVDEIFDLDTARKGWLEIATEGDGFPPLFAWLLKSWLLVFPDATAARALPLMFSVLTIPLVARLATRWGGIAAGVWAAWLLACSPLHIHYAREVRSYALLSLAVAGSWLWLDLVYARRDRLSWGVFAVWVVVGCWTHYFFAAALLCGIFATAWIHDEDRRSQVVITAGAWVLLLVASSPLLLLLSGDLHRQTTWPSRPPFALPAFAYTVFSWFSGFSIGPSARELHSLSSRNAIFMAAPWGSVLLLILGALAFGIRSWSRPRWWWAMVATTIGGLLAMGIGCNVLGVGYNVRYVSWLVIPLVISLAGGIVAGSPRQLSAAATVALFLFFALALANRTCLPKYQTEDARGLAAYLKSHRQQPVILISGYMSLPVGHYLDGHWPLTYLDFDLAPQQRDPALADLLRHEIGDQPFWYVESRTFHEDAAGTLRARLDTYAELTLESRFAGIELYAGRPRTDVD
ncbi:MAG: glycosyltransferase family 39 protein [Planctomycetales bacterium]|nr:glycosyltransferase family 39 protein [Planctomycetales bacterium]